MKKITAILWLLFILTNPLQARPPVEDESELSENLFQNSHFTNGFHYSIQAGLTVTIAYMLHNKAARHNFYSYNPTIDWYGAGTINNIKPFFIAQNIVLSQFAFGVASVFTILSWNNLFNYFFEKVFPS